MAQERKFKHGKEVVTVTELSNGSLICETTDAEYNKSNELGHWIATEEDIQQEIKLGNYIQKS